MSDLSTTKSVIALAVVVGCFAILWPKIFFPMMQAAIKKTSPADAAVENNARSASASAQHRPSHLHPGMGGEPIRRPENLQRKPGRPPIPRHPGQIMDQPSQSSQGGIMGLVMPVYTIGVILFFFYTLFKVMSKKPDKTPKVKNYNMDPEHRKFVFSEEYDGDVNLRRRNAKPSEPTIPETDEEEEEEEERQNISTREDELIQLRQRLANTEAAMARILKQMGDASQKLSTTVPQPMKKSNKQSKISLKAQRLKKIKTAREKVETEQDYCEEIFDDNDRVSNQQGKEKKATVAKEANKSSSPITEDYDILEEQSENEDFSNEEEADDDDDCSKSTNSSPVRNSNKSRIEEYDDESCCAKTASFASNSSFEYISSNENTPLSPDKDISIDNIRQNISNESKKEQ